ncbi:neuritin 1-like a [Callorhinchus milii]|uniref:neuritin 1-like a n=1 Tax=Callorhinchus milii TaxID=7868 RepID=UPI001C3F56D7|nr:neuritin 1-like a [Callorhinchus milii]
MVVQEDSRDLGSLWQTAKKIHLLLLDSVCTAATDKKCNHIYKGFAECLLKLGESLTRSMEEEGEEVKELDTVCRSWDDFHSCADSVLEGCPDEAASIWESLRKESKKLKFEGNLHELCSSRVRLSGTMQELDGDESNKQSLTGSADSLWCGLTTPVLSFAVLMVNM